MELATYCEALDAMPIKERTSLMIEWSEKRADVWKEYVEDRPNKNIVEHVLTNLLETKINDELTLVEQLIMQAINNEKDKIDFKGLEKLYKLTGGSTKHQISGELTISPKVRELSK